MWLRTRYPCGVRPETQRPPFQAAFGENSGLGLACVGSLSVSTLGHELVELGPILRQSQPFEKLAELTLLFLEPAERVGAVLIKRAVAAGGRISPPTTPGTSPGSAAHAGAHPIHPALHAIDLVLPMLLSASHSSAPDGESEGTNPKRPPDHEAKDDQRDPGGFS